MKKKERKKIKIKKSNTVKISLSIFVIILCIYLIFYYSGKEEIEMSETQRVSDHAQKSTISDKLIETETPSLITPEIPITTTIEKQKPTKFISDLKCVNGNIMMSFTNILNKPKKISDFTFLIAGRANRNPQCELTYLEPGESTFCQNLNAGLKFRKKVMIAVGYPAHYENAVVDCGKKTSITANIISDIRELFIKLFGIS